MKITEDIEYIDVTRGTIVLADGTELPITDWFDRDGEDCDPADAVAVVAGSDEFGWIDVDVSQPETLH